MMNDKRVKLPTYREVTKALQIAYKAWDDVLPEEEHKFLLSTIQHLKNTENWKYK